MTQEICKECEKIENVKETLKVHAEQIETNRKDIADIKAEDKETKLYVRMILEKIDQLTLGFENMRIEKEKERSERIKELESSRKKNEQEFKHVLIDSFWFTLKILIFVLALLGGMKAAVLLDLVKLLQ